MRRDEIKGYGEHVLSGGIGMVAPLMKEGERRSPLPFVQYRVGQKVCPMLRDPASARMGEFTQPRTNFFGHLCTLVIRYCDYLGTLIKEIKTAGTAFEIDQC